MSSSGTLEKLLPDGREDVDEHDFFVEHRRAMPEAAREEHDVAWTEDSLLGSEDETDTAAFDDRHLFVHVIVGGEDGARRDRETADHQRLAVHHLAGDAVAEALVGDGGPVPRLRA